MATENRLIPIAESTRIADIAAAIPSSVRVFQRHQIDFCCGGRSPVGEVCAARGLSVEALVKEIESSAAGRADDRDWRQAPLPELTAHIVAAYHEPLRAELSRLEDMAAKVARVHGAKDAALGRIDAVVRDFSEDLRGHMQKEERVLFPAIERIAAGGPAPLPLVAPIHVMETEHDRAGALLEELRRLTGDYQPPAWACATTRALFHGLGELESEMHLHVHLENNILFPRALAEEPRRA